MKIGPQTRITKINYFKKFGILVTNTSASFFVYTVFHINLKIQNLIFPNKYFSTRLKIEFFHFSLKGFSFSKIVGLKIDRKMHERVKL